MDFRRFRSGRLASLLTDGLSLGASKSEGLQEKNGRPLWRSCAPSPAHFDRPADDGSAHCAASKMPVGGMRRKLAGPKTDRHQTGAQQSAPDHPNRLQLIQSQRQHPDCSLIATR
jgi:hypothetical protein